MKVQIERRDNGTWSAILGGKIVAGIVQTGGEFEVNGDQLNVADGRGFATLGDATKYVDKCCGTEGVSMQTTEAEVGRAKAAERAKENKRARAVAALESGERPVARMAPDVAERLAADIENADLVAIQARGAEAREAAMTAPAVLRPAPKPGNKRKDASADIAAARVEAGLAPEAVPGPTKMERRKGRKATTMDTLVEGVRELKAATAPSAKSADRHERTAAVKAERQAKAPAKTKAPASLEYLVAANKGGALRATLEAERGNIGLYLRHVSVVEDMLDAGNVKPTQDADWSRAVAERVCFPNGACNVYVSKATAKDLLAHAKTMAKHVDAADPTAKAWAAQVEDLEAMVKHGGWRAALEAKAVR